MKIIKMLRRYFFVLFIFLLSFSELTVTAQTIVTGDTTSLALLLIKAREFAFNDGKAQARKICRQILSRDSTYWDASVLMGRTYAWDEKYDSARIVLNNVIEQRPGHYDAIEALIDAELLGDNYLRAIKYADIGLSYHPNDGAFLYKKARALYNSGNSQKATELLNQILVINPSNNDASGLLLSIRKDKMVNKLTLNYWAYLFKDDNQWSFGSVAIGRKFSKLGTVTLRYNYAQRFGNEGHQFEFDAYPTITKGVYMYFSSAISNKKNFPYSRLSLEPYFSLPFSLELSFGFRYLNFDDNRIIALDSNKVMIYTGSIGKYYGNYWFSLRPYFTPGVGAWSESFSLTIRRYLDGADSYLSLVVGAGVSPDEQQYAFDPAIYYLKSNKIALDYQQKIGSQFFLNCGAGFAREEIRANTKRNRYSLDIGVSYIF